MRRASHSPDTRERPARDGGPLKPATFEDRRHGADGKTLDIRRAVETPRGERSESVPVFVKD